MRVSEQGVHTVPPVRTAPVFDGTTDWATQTRRVLTRDLLLRAARAQPGERRALEFRALHLNLPLVGEVADRLALTDVERTRVEHAALEGLARALRAFDPAGPDEFAEVASRHVEQEILAQRALPRPSRRHLRQVIRRLVVAKASHRL
jgi:DNA-directed RNA polymerase specialized sigma subunit